MLQSEFLEMYKHLFPKGDAEKFALLTFKNFDKNGDGSVDFKEFICALYVTSRGQFFQITSSSSLCSVNLLITAVLALYSIYSRVYYYTNNIMK